jgi:hypothetical protein
MPENDKGILTRPASGRLAPWEKLYPFVVVVKIENNPTFLIQKIYNMRKFAPFLFLLLLTGTAAWSQDCTNYFFLQKGKVIEIGSYDKKGDSIGRQVYSVTDVSMSGGTVTGNLSSEVFNKKGKSIGKATGKIKCNGGIMMVDMKLMVPPPPQGGPKGPPIGPQPPQPEPQGDPFSGANVKADSVYLEYPATMKPGDALKDVNFTMTITGNGPTRTVNMVINDRKVEAQESVTTPAGTWNCYKISFRSKVTAKMGPFGFPVNVDGAEWYAPGFGIVKTQSKSGSTAITSIK